MHHTNHNSQPKGFFSETSYCGDFTETIISIDHELLNWNRFCISNFYKVAGGISPSHNIDHSIRVLRTAFWLSEEFPSVDKTVLLIACYFHDANALAKNHPESAKSSKISADYICRLFGNAGLSDKRTKLLHSIILSHSYSSKVECETSEAKLLSDSDKLDALGAIGIARLFSTAGEIGSKLYNASEPFAEKRCLDDSKYALDHFFKKILNIPGKLYTKKAKSVAEQRVAFIQTFLKEFREEISSF